jgi:hypothetical protein
MIQRVQLVLGVAGIIGFFAAFVLFYWLALEEAQRVGLSPLLGFIGAILSGYAPWGLYLAAYSGTDLAINWTPLKVLAAMLPTALLMGVGYFITLNWTSDDSAHSDVSFVLAGLTCWTLFSAWTIVRKAWKARQA